MSFHSIEDPAFWGQNLSPLANILESGGGSGIEFSLFFLGDRPGNPPYVIPLRMEPGYVLARHAHDCHRMEIVVQGSLEADGRILTPGAVMISGPGEFYGPHVAGPEGCTTFEIFSDFKGGSRMSVDSGDGGAIDLDMSSRDDARTMVENARRQQTGALGG